MQPQRVFLLLARVHEVAHAVAAQGVHWLSSSEQARFARLKTPLRQAQFLSGRWLARQVLMASHGGPVDRWSLCAPESGPPQVRDAQVQSGQVQAGTIHLALSHSGDHVACAVSAFPVGLDLEAPGQRKRNLAGVVELICTPGERARWPAEEGPEQSRCFYDLWTLKEAWIKSRAEDLSPARLARIHTQRTASGQRANATLWHASEFTLALVADAQASIQWLASESSVNTAGEHWTIEDAPLPGSLGTDSGSGAGSGPEIARDPTKLA